MRLIECAGSTVAERPVTIEMLSASTLIDSTGLPGDTFATCECHVSGIGCMTKAISAVKMRHKGSLQVRVLCDYHQQFLQNHANVLYAIGCQPVERVIEFMREVEKYCEEKV